MNWYKIAMNIELGEKGLKNSWQREFPSTTECCRCGGESRIGFVAQEDDEKEYVCDLHKNEGEGGYWLHDACAVAVYFCKDCLETTALYNQG